MVRRVRLGRRDAPARARRWLGPPPLLVLVTLVGFAVAPFLDQQPAPPERAVTAAHESAPESRSQPEGRSPRTPLTVPESRAGRVATGVEPLRREPVRVGVASFNMFRSLGPGRARSDARRLTRDPKIDVVGWQEAERFGGILHALDGWTTKTFAGSQGAAELAVSWRQSRFRFVSARQEQLIPGVTGREGRFPFGDRAAVVVVLEERSTGRRFAVVDVHLPPAIENLSRPGAWRDTLNAERARRQLHDLAGVWRTVEARWAVGTGDYNFDASGDERHRAPGAPIRTIGRFAVSSYEALGARGLRATYPSNGRHIDYVWVDRTARREGRMRFTAQWVVGGLNSDHNALVTRLELS